MTNNLCDYFKKLLRLFGMTTPTQERQFVDDEKFKLPAAFIWRRLHSLLGLWLVIYLCEHLLVNSQAALFYKDDGSSFVAAVNRLEAIPYLKIVEIVILGLPFLIHGIWGIYYAWTSKPNTYHSSGNLPALPQYKRNRAYSWQRITAWLLAIAILLHVFHMRFWSYPTIGEGENYMVRVTEDPGLTLVAEKLGVVLFNPKSLQSKENALKDHELQLSKNVDSLSQSEHKKLLEEIDRQKQWLQSAKKKSLKSGELLAVSTNAGAAFFLMVRDTFKSPSLVILYSLFVIAAAYHAFQGLWTFMITWGITLTRRSQKRMRTASHFFMGLTMLLGLMAAWGTYWTIQFQR